MVWSEHLDFGVLPSVIGSDVDRTGIHVMLRQTRFGSVAGYVDHARHVMVWKGIPFAAPPIGSRRWKAPIDPAPWSEVRSARTDPVPCAQLVYEPTWIRRPVVHGSEDCLYLNVFRPDTDEIELPVYFWIHGGANNSGYAAEYPMENFARKSNTVVVVPQYRLNVFGFFTHPALRAEASPEEASGNFGALDQIKALHWVQENIAAFGGNPANVTIAGESAGAHNVSALLVSPLSRGLFHRAIMQSGFMRWDSRDQADAISARTFEVASRMKGGSPGPAAMFLSALNTQELVQAHAGGPGQTALPLGNQIEDGYLIPGNLLSAFAQGHYARVPILLGTNARETGLTSVLLPPLYEGMPDYRDLNEVSYGRRALDSVLRSPRDRQLYAKANFFGSLFWRTAHTDEFSRRIAQHQEIYSYSFQWGDERSRPGDLGFIYGAAHGTEIPFFHGNVDDESSATSVPWAVFNGMTAVNRPGRIELSRAIVEYVAEFVRNGTPNREGSGLPHWQPWSNNPGGQKCLALGADQNHAWIHMESEEFSMEQVWASLDAEPVDEREHILAVVSAIQGFYVKRLPRLRINV